MCDEVHSNPHLQKLVTFTDKIPSKFKVETLLLFDFKSLMINLICNLKEEPLMLSVQISYPNQINIEEILIKAGFKKTSQTYILETSSQKELARGNHEENMNNLTITFPKNLALEEYKQIHKAISSIANQSVCTVDDSNSQLGYLQNGEVAYILTNWSQWIYFLERARHRSMEGQKVRVLNENGFEIGNGILTEYTITDSLEDGFQIEKCTLITTFGESSFLGPNIKIEPTGEW